MSQPEEEHLVESQPVNVQIPRTTPTPKRITYENLESGSILLGSTFKEKGGGLFFSNWDNAEQIAISQRADQKWYESLRNWMFSPKKPSVKRFVHLPSVNKRGTPFESEESKDILPSIICYLVFMGLVAAAERFLITFFLLDTVEIPAIVAFYIVTFMGAYGYFTPVARKALYVRAVKLNHTTLELAANAYVRSSSGYGLRQAKVKALENGEETTDTKEYKLPLYLKALLKIESLRNSSVVASLVVGFAQRTLVKQSKSDYLQFDHAVSVVIRQNLAPSVAGKMQSSNMFLDEPVRPSQSVATTLIWPLYAVIPLVGAVAAVLLLPTKVILPKNVEKFVTAATVTVFDSLTGLVNDPLIDHWYIGRSAFFGKGIKIRDARLMAVYLSDPSAHRIARPWFFVNRGMIQTLAIPSRLTISNLYRRFGVFKIYHQVLFFMGANFTAGSTTNLKEVTARTQSPYSQLTVGYLIGAGALIGAAVIRHLFVMLGQIKHIPVTVKGSLIDHGAIYEWVSDENGETELNEALISSIDKPIWEPAVALKDEIVNPPDHSQNQQYAPVSPIANPPIHHQPTQGQFLPQQQTIQPVHQLITPGSQQNPPVQHVYYPPFQPGITNPPAQPIYYQQVMPAATFPPQNSSFQQYYTIPPQGYSQIPPNGYNTTAPQAYVANYPQVTSMQV
ncbi:hypothetical protein HK098_003032 [Nowakowskiella sp. JEL0407]|nr:hypothetical protein HK098_003032 [Nowakowskiella sp. JEL0407]